MDKKLIIAGVILVFVFVGGYLYVSNKGTPANVPVTSEFRERTRCDQFLTETDMESVMGGGWTSPSELVKVQGDLCTITFRSDGKSLELSASPSVISGVNVYDLLHSRLKSNEQLSDTNEIGDKSFRITTNNVKKVVFQEKDMVFIISGSGMDFEGMIGVGRTIGGIV